MLAAAAKGQLRALYVVGANPVKTFAIDAKDRLGKLELLVVQDLFLTETAMLADIVLPAAAAYEKNGTMTNTAGEVQLVRKGGDVMARVRTSIIFASFRTSLRSTGSGSDPPAHSRSCLRRNPEVRGRIRRLPGDAASRRI